MKRRLKAQDEKSPLIVPRGVEVTPVGLRITGKLSYSEWSGMVGGFQRVHRSILWDMGDALAWGEDTFGEEFAQAISEYSKGAQYNAMWVSRQIPISRRREVLSWSHHAEVAMLEPEEQDRFLQEAIDREWGVHELRAAVRLFRNSPPKGIDYQESRDGPAVVPQAEPEFGAMEDVRPQQYYPEFGERIGDLEPSPVRVNVEADFNRLLGICRALRLAEKQQNDAEVTRQRTAMDFFLAEIERREEQAQ